MSAHRDDCWCCRTLAGSVGGFGLAIALAGIFVWVGPAGPGKYQLAMWLVAPVWLAVLSAAFLFRNGPQAWLWLGGANLLAYAGLFVCRHFSR
ncbi:MAG: hypothetical protein NVV74_03350 [Magnetospirillum sp.]|nr:hypothetical protein [Magnetospirillum sp.]